MCNMDEAASIRLPFQILLVLAVCVCSLVVHNIAEGLVPVDGSSGFDLTAQEEYAHMFDEDCDDNFIFPFQTPVPVEHLSAFLHCAVSTCTRSFLISPLLPPPNS